MSGKLDLFRNPISAQTRAFSEDSRSPANRLWPSGYVDSQGTGSSEKSSHLDAKAGFERGLFPLFEVKKLVKHFYVGKDKWLCALNGISFEIMPHETLGLVGESGCGKSTTGKMLLRLHEATSGEILYLGKDLAKLSSEDAKTFRKKTQVIFQDPYSSLNPRMTAESIIKEPLAIHNIGSKNERKQRVLELLTLVGLNNFAKDRYPHEFSGGQRQRIGIARALSVSPDFIVCDEPLSALDVSVQAQIVNLLKKLQEEMGLTYLFISHDLKMVKYLSRRIAVMYLGDIVELAPSDDLYKSPFHPYTKALLSAIPLPDPKLERSRQKIMLPGDPPSPLNLPKGCPFASRCPYVMPLCREVKPPMKEVGSGHTAACHLN